MDENKRKRTWEKVMNSFTDDLWIEIFLSLPIKSLLRFKSVSKSWFSIISSHRFAISHLARATKDDQLLIVHHQPVELEQYEYGSYSLFHLGEGRISKNLKFPYSQGEYPSGYTCSMLVGSDCGIVCVLVNLSYWRDAKNKFDIYLWNPATKHSKLIPPFSTPDNQWTSGTLGFGFDHIDLDFKVVRVASLDSRTISVEVYTLNRNSWRKIDSDPIDIPRSNTFNVCFHGFLLAIGGNSGIMAFDLHKELFIWDINLPVSSFYDAEVSSETCLTDFKDTIAVIIFNTDNGKIELWTLEDEACLRGGGLKALWTKVLNIDVGVPFFLIEGLFNNFQFFLVNRDGDRFMYDLNKKVTTYVTVPPYFETCELCKYTKSLLSLEGFKQIKWASSSSSLQDSSDCDVEMNE